jgi:hypothetical protein
MALDDSPYAFTDQLVVFNENHAIPHVSSCLPEMNLPEDTLMEDRRCSILNWLPIEQCPI